MQSIYIRPIGCFQNGYVFTIRKTMIPCEKHRNVRTFLAPLIDVKVRGSVDFRGRLTHRCVVLFFPSTKIYFVLLGFCYLARFLMRQHHMHCFNFDLAQGGVLKEKYLMCAFVKVTDENRLRH